jgi:hypothetical protein
MKNLFKIISLLFILTFTSDVFSASFTLSSGYVVADNYYVASNGNNNNTCKTTGDPCATEQGVLSKLPNNIDKNVTINVASGTITPTATNGAGIYNNKRVSGGNLLTIKGTFNSTANSFTNVPFISNSISTGSNTNNFPVDSTPADNQTYFNGSGFGSTDSLAGYYLHLLSGPGYLTGTFDYQYNWYLIIGNSSTQLKIAGKWWSTLPDNATHYEIYRPSDMSIIAGTNISSCIYNQLSENITYEFLNCSAPAVGTVKTVNTVESKNININMSQINGGNSISDRSESYYFADHIPVTATIDYGIECVNHSACQMVNSYLYGYKTEGLDVVADSTFSVIGNLIFTATTTWTGPMPPAAIYADMLSYVSLTNNKLYSHSATTYNSYAVFVNYSGGIWAASNNEFACFSNAANTGKQYGIIVDMKGSFEMNGATANELVNNCWRGVHGNWNGVYDAIINPTYTNIGAGGNESFTNGAVKVTSLP